MNSDNSVKREWRKMYADSAQFKCTAKESKSAFLKLRGRKGDVF